MEFDIIKESIINSILLSKCTNESKIMMLSFLFFNLVWDFDYYRICGSLEGDINHEST